jgi:hypothetical protein
VLPSDAEIAETEHTHQERNRTTDEREQPQRTDTTIPTRRQTCKDRTQRQHKHVSGQGERQRNHGTGIHKERNPANKKTIKQFSTLLFDCMRTTPPSTIHSDPCIDG